VGAELFRWAWDGANELGKKRRTQGVIQGKKTRGTWERAGGEKGEKRKDTTKPESKRRKFYQEETKH